MKNVLLLAIFLLFHTVVLAGGYRVSLQGHRALAMGHAGVAIVNSESVFFNPAALTHLESKWTVSAGGFGVFSNTAYQNEATGAFTTTDNPVGTPFYAYATYKVNERWAVGLGVYTPFGSRVEYEDDWAGSHLVNNIELSTLFVQPTVSLKLGSNISIGAGPIYAVGSVNFNQNLNRTLTDLEGNRSEVTVDASGVSDWGWTAGIMAKLSENITLGANYRSKIVLTADDATADFENIPNSPLTPFTDTTATADLPLPAELTVGVAYQKNQWTFAFQYDRTFWNIYESLDIDFADPNVPDSSSPRNYKNASTFRFGVEFVATSRFTLRAGYYFDESPVQPGFFSPETPRNDSSGYTAGLTFNVTSRLEIDTSFVFLRFEEIDASYEGYFENGVVAPFRGSYKSNAFIPGMGITYKL